MASDDIPNAISILGDFSHMKSLADRLQQGFVNQLYLGRLLIHPQGFAADPRSRARWTRATCSSTATARAASSAGR